MPQTYTLTDTPVIPEGALRELDDGRHEVMHDLDAARVYLIIRDHRVERCEVEGLTGKHTAYLLRQTPLSGQILPDKPSLWVVVCDNGACKAYPVPD